MGSILVTNLFRQRTVSFFSGHNENFLLLQKNANFPPEPKTDTTAQPARQTTVSFIFSGRNHQNRAPIRQTTVSLAVFLLWREIFITTGKKKIQVVCLAGCAVVSVFGSGGI